VPFVIRHGFHDDRFTVRAKSFVGGERMISIVPFPKLVYDLTDKLRTQAQVIKMPNEPGFDQV
jgi:hypothetical protein